MALSRGSHVRVPKPIFPSQVAPMDQRAGPVCVHADTVAVWPTRTGRIRAANSDCDQGLNGGLGSPAQKGSVCHGQQEGGGRRGKDTSMRATD
jgi:hypothetical protein